MALHAAETAAVSARVALLVLAACGSSSPPPVAPAPAVAVVAVTPPPSEQEQRAQIVAAHRKIEEEQQDAFAATCGDAEAHPRCMPSCYAKEPADSRAGKKPGGALEIQHVACKPFDGADYAVAIVDELDRAKLAVRAARGRVPAAHKTGAWQAEVENALATGLPRGDAIRVTGAWRDVVHPLTKEHLRCVAVSQYTRAVHHALDACGGDGAIACEATGNAAAHGINVVHYRLAEARALQAANKPTECQEAALEAIAVARGLPRWRQYVTLNVAKWVAHAGYRTRFDGILDEDTLFTRATTLGSDAEAVYAACGGPSGAPTTAAQEQSFHTCW